MRAVAPPVVYGGRFAAFRRLSGRHKWRPYVCGRLNVVLWRLVCGVARGGAIHDARCRNGTCGRPRCVSADAGGASVGLSFCGGRFAAPRRSSGRHKWRPYVCGWLNAVLWRLVCGVARGGAIHDARCRNGTCGWSRCVSADVGGAMVGLRRRPWGAIHDARCRNGTCGRSRCVSVDAGGATVDCCFAAVIRASQVAPLRLRAVDCCFAGGCWRRNGGLSGEGDGYEKRSRTDVAVSVWLLVVAEARLERTTSRL